MSYFEKELIKRVSLRFRNIRGSRKIGTISSGQVSTIKRIESGKNTNSGNFIPDSLLYDYSQIFNIKKSTLIFGTDSEIENLLEITFDNYFQEILSKKKINDGLENFYKSFIDYLCIFAEFSTWYNLKLDQKCSLLFIIPWYLIKRKLVNSFKNRVINNIFKDENSKFLFKEIDEQFTQWLNYELANIFFPEVINKLKKETIFKIGFMINFLTKEIIEPEIPILENDSIPFKYLRLKKNLDYMTSVMLKTDKGVRFKRKYSPPKNNEVRKKELVPEQKILNRNDFLNYVRSDRGKLAGHVPGLLTVNSRASKYMQLELNDLMLNHVKEYTAYQNKLLSLIEISELEDFL